MSYQADPCTLHLPHKDWANDPRERDNYAELERYSLRLRNCGPHTGGAGFRSVTRATYTYTELAWANNEPDLWFEDATISDQLGPVADNFQPVRIPSPYGSPYLMNMVSGLFTWEVTVRFGDVGGPAIHWNGVYTDMQARNSNLYITDTRFTALSPADVAGSVTSSYWDISHGGGYYLEAEDAVNLSAVHQAENPPGIQANVTFIATFTLMEI